MRVYVISAYPTVRAGLAALVREQPGWIVAGESAPDGVTHSLRAPAPQPGNAASAEVDVVLADLEIVPDADTLASWLTTLQPRGGIVVLTPPADARSRGPATPAVARVLADVAGVADDHNLAFAALLRDATGSEIAAAIGAVGGGLITLDRRLASTLFATAERLATPAPEHLSATDEPLTARELDVLQLLAQGLPNKTIANRLHISEHTAKFHVSAIMTKLGAASRTEAVTRAARQGLLIL